MKKRTLCLVLLTALALAAAPAPAESAEPLHIAMLKGPTGMGAAQLMTRAAQGVADQPYAFQLEGAPDAITGRLITGELDMAALPTNVIAMLAAKTGGGVQALAVNTLGVLYLLERGERVHSVADLWDKTVVMAGQGTTTSAVADHLFGDDVTVDFVSEHTEAVALALAGRYDLVLLPEPYVTSLLAQDDSFRVAIDLSAAWEEATGTQLPMGGIAVRADFAAERPQAVAAFLEEYGQSVAFANDSPAEAALLIDALDIMAAGVAEEAIPRCNMVLITGEEMRQALEAFYAVLLEGSGGLIGGAMPGDDFYYVP